MIDFFEMHHKYVHEEPEKEKNDKFMQTETKENVDRDNSETINKDKE